MERLDLTGLRCQPERFGRHVEKPKALLKFNRGSILSLLALWTAI
jgi:hypothetical protein